MTRPARKPQKITGAEVTSIARRYENLARILRTYGTDIMRNVAVALEVGFPPSASTSPSTPANEVDENGKPVQSSTIPERYALNTGDDAAREAAYLIGELRTHAYETTPHVTNLLKQWKPDRAPTLCARCGNPFPPDSAICNHVNDDGRRCAGREDEIRRCENPHHGIPLAAGEKRWKGSDGLYRCDTCRRFHDRNQRDRIPADTGLALDADRLMIAEPDPPTMPPRKKP